MFGLAPLLQLAPKPRGGHQGRGQARYAKRRRHRVRSGSVVAEVALAVVLVVGAGLLVRTFLNLSQVDAGFDRRGSSTFALVLPDAN